MALYTVKFRLNNSESAYILDLHGGTESEAREKLLRQGTIKMEQLSNFYIISITKV